MPVPNRALIAAPVARNLHAEHPEHWVAAVPGGIVGPDQLWDTLDQDFWVALNDPQLIICPDLPTLRQRAPSVYEIVVQANRSDSGTQRVNVAMKRISEMAAADFWQVVTASGTVVRNGLPIAGDIRPAGVYRTDWALVHEWAGSPGDTLGA